MTYTPPDKIEIYAAALQSDIDAMMDERVKLGLPALPTKEHP